MLLSMTGYGEAHHQDDRLGLSLELRAVNNRHLKITLRATEPYHLLEAEVERVIRKSVKRGTVQVQLRATRKSAAGDFRLNTAALGGYVAQAVEAAKAGDWPDGCLQAVLSGALALPGVVPESAAGSANLEADWPTVERVLEDALARLQAMRREEGGRMAHELLALRSHIGERLAQLREHLPAVAENYRERLYERVGAALAAHGVALDPAVGLREVALYAERADVTEEVVRLASHLEQFADVVNRGAESAGRTLEFLVQEMGRESNTIGSKAGDVTVSRHAVEIKTALEKVRELIQNVE